MRSRRGRPGGRTPAGGGITSVRFHRLYETTLSGVTGNATLLVNPQTTSLGALSEIGDQFDLFRCAELEYRLHPMNPADTNQQVCAYIPDVDIQTATAFQASESPIAAVQTQFCGVPSPWIHVPPSQLKGMLDWYKCSADAGAAEFEAQGIILLAGGLSDTIIVEFRGIMQFKNPVSTTIQMARMLKRAADAGLCVLLQNTKIAEVPAESTAKPKEGRAPQKFAFKQPCAHQTHGFATPERTLGNKMPEPSTAVKPDPCEWCQHQP